MVKSTAPEVENRPSYLAATIAAVLVFVLYLITLAPSTAMWDTSEYIAAAYVLGIPHPPGNPFFVLLGHVVSLLPIAPNVAERINIMAAACSAISAGMWFLITERVLEGWLPERWQRLVGASIAVLVGSTAFTVWNQSVVNEKVYTVSLVFFAVVAWLTVLWCDDPDGPKADRLLVLIAFLIGLGYANHPAGFLVAPAVGVAVLARRWHTLLRWRLMLACVAALFLGMTPFLYEPIRAAHFPAINEGEPTACQTTFHVSCTFDKVTYDRLLDNINRVQYGKPDVTQRQASFPAQIGMYWLYFKWQWLRDLHGDHPGLQNVLAAVFFILGLFGGYAHWRYDRRSFWFFGPLIFTVTLALIYYLNFKYGYSQAPELGDTVPREVRDRDYFYLWSFSAWSVWVALGFVYLWEALAALVGTETSGPARNRSERPTRRSWVATSPLLVLAFIPLLVNWKAASRAGQTETRDFAKDLLNSVEPYGVLVTVGDNDTFPLWYAQEVEGIRRDVVIANTSLLNTDWYTRQMLRRPVYDYDSLAGPPVYRGHVWKKPTGPVMKMTLAQADSVPLAYEITGPEVIRKPGTNFVATIDPHNLPHGVLERADVFVLHLILDNDDRSVYLSSTSGNYGRQLGIADYLLTQGLARKVENAVPAATKDTVNLQGEGWFDLKRSLALWDVFSAPKALIRRGDWVDKPSVNIPALYVMTGYFLAEGLAQAGDRVHADSVLRTATEIAKASGLEDVFRPQVPTAPAALPFPESGDVPRAAPLPKPSARAPTRKAPTAAPADTTK
jgi:transmembrane protein TMEM260 (protein O-mannosyltransferase)